MKTALIFIAAAASALAQQNFDFKTLDKLAAHAKESTNISLDGDTLKAATGLLGGDKDSAVLKNLKSVHVISYEYEKEGQYNAADLDAVRAYVRSLKWSKIVESKSQTENTEIYLQGPQNNQPGGLAVISSEPTEVTVIVISGSLSLSDLGKLGSLGVPSDIVSHGSDKKQNSGKND